jgi:hypothetical protein
LTIAATRLWNGRKLASKKWGVYHFGTNNITDAVTEANFFVDNCVGYVGKGLLMLDNEAYEWSNGTVAHNPYNVQLGKGLVRPCARPDWREATDLHEPRCHQWC